MVFQQQNQHQIQPNWIEYEEEYDVFNGDIMGSPKPTTDPSADPSLISDEYIEGMNGSFDETPSSKTTTDPTRDPTADQTVIIVVINEWGDW